MKKYKTKWPKILTKKFFIEQYTDLKKSTPEIAKEVKCD